MPDAKLSTPEEPFFLSPMDNTMFFFNFPLLLFLPTQPESCDRAIQALFSGFRHLLQAMPLLTGSVRAVSKELYQPRTRAVVSPYRTPEAFFAVKDRRRQKKCNYQSLREQGFPPTKLAIWDFTRFDLTCNIDPPAIHAQITLLEGGLVLAVSPNHSVTDASGIESIVRIWAACCRGDSIEPEKAACLLQRPDVPPYPDKVSLSDMPPCTYLKKGRNRYLPGVYPWKLTGIFQQIVNKTLLFSGIALVKLTSLTHPARFITFSSADLAELKDSVVKAMPLFELADPPKYISTRSSFLLSHANPLFRSPPETQTEGFHRRLLRRLRRESPNPGPDRSEISARFFVAVNLRKYFPSEHPRDLICNNLTVVMVEFSLPTLEATISGVKAQAQKLRSALQSIDYAYISRAFSFAKSVPGISKLDLDFGPNPEYHCLLSSWKHLEICPLDWGNEVGQKVERAASNLCYLGLG